MQAKSVGAVALSLILVGAAFAAWWFYMPNPKPSASQQQASQKVVAPVEEKREVPALPKPVETAKPPVPEIPAPQLRDTAEVIRELVKAGEDCNLVACRVAYDELKSRTDVPAKVVATEFETQAAKERSSRQQLFILGFLGLLLDAADYPSLFSYLRSVWTNEGLNEARTKIWSRTELMPVDRAAEAALTNDKDIMHADVVAFVMRERSLEGSHEKLAGLIKEMLAPYDEFKLADRKAMKEIPDPWISRVFTRTVGELRFSEKESPVVALYKDMCGTVAAGGQYSPRLRAQARLYFLPITKDFIDLLIAIGASVSQTECGKLMAAFFDAQNADAITWSLLWDALIEKYGTPKAMAAIMSTFTSSRKLKNIADAQQYATAMANDFMAGNGNPDHALLLNCALRDLISSREHFWRDAKEGLDIYRRPGLFVATGVDVAELVRRLRRMLPQIEKKYSKIHGVTFLTQLLQNIFEGDTALPEVLTTAKELAEQIPDWADVLTETSLRELIGPRNADLLQYPSEVKSFVEYLLEREIPKPATHAVRSSKHFAVQALCSLAACLKLVLYPRLSDKAVASIKRMEAVASEFAKETSETYIKEALKPAITELRAEGYLPR